MKKILIVVADYYEDISSSLLKSAKSNLSNFSLKIIAHKNHEPIKKLVSLGAIEVKNYDDLSADIQCLIICVTNTPVAKEIANQIASKLPSNILVIVILLALSRRSSA